MVIIKNSLFKNSLKKHKTVRMHFPPKIQLRSPKLRYESVTWFCCQHHNASVQRICSTLMSETNIPYIFYLYNTNMSHVQAAVIHQTIFQIQNSDFLAKWFPVLAPFTIKVNYLSPPVIPFYPISVHLLSLSP